MQMAADGGPQLPLSLRAGVPPGFVYRHGVSAEVAPKLTEAALQNLLSAGPGPAVALGGAAAAADAAAALARGLRDAAAAVEAAPEVAAVEAQAMGAEFMRARLPPHPATLPPSGPEPTLKSRVCCRKAVRSPPLATSCSRKMRNACMISSAAGMGPQSGMEGRRPYARCRARGSGQVCCPRATQSDHFSLGLLTASRPIQRSYISP